MNELTPAYLASQGLSENFPQRFWAKVKKTEGCWVWTGALMQGYGNIVGKSYGRKFRINFASHRASWVLHFGPIPDGVYVLHHCDNRPCVRPDHLWLGTASDNMKDMYQKERHPRLQGLKQPLHKLTEAEVLEIRRLYSPELGNGTALAKQFKVCFATIYPIIHRKTWAHI